jgi:hypothetical protein
MIKITKSDEDLIESVIKYMDKHKNASRTEVRKACGTSMERLNQLHTDGLVKLNPKLSLSQAAKLNRTRNKIADEWYIKSKASWQK